MISQEPEATFIEVQQAIRILCRAAYNDVDRAFHLLDELIELMRPEFGEISVS